MTRVLLTLGICLFLLCGLVATENDVAIKAHDESISSAPFMSLKDLLGSDGQIDMSKIRASNYRGALEADGIRIGVNPRSGEPTVREPSPPSPADHPDDIYWSGGFAKRGVEQDVMALAVYDNKLIVGGFLYQAGDSVVNNIAAWDGVSWKPLGSGLNGFVYSLTVFGGKLIAGGTFTSAGGSPANGIAAWDGSSWSLLGTGISGQAGSINAMTIYDGKLIVGGSFDQAGGVTANYIAAWDGASWSALGTGMDWDVNALAVYGTDLIAGGFFSLAGGNTANRVAAWSGTTWSDLGSNIAGSVHALAVFDNKLIVGGAFLNAGGVADADHIAAYNGAWSALETGTGGSVSELLVFSSLLIADHGYGLKAWDGGEWSTFATEADNGFSVLTEYNGNLIGGGSFKNAGGTIAYGVALWDGADWQPFGSGYGLDGTVMGLASLDNTLFAGGGFQQAGEMAASLVASWYGFGWSLLGSGMLGGAVNAFTLFDGNVVAVGGFNTADGSPANRIASWDGFSWSPLGDGANFEIHAVIDYNSDLYVGGSFTTAGGFGASRVAAWDGVNWAPLGSGLNQSVFAMAVYNNTLIVGGAFTTAGGAGANRIAAWDGANWTTLGMGLNGTVWALATYDGLLIAGGEFTTAGGSSTNNIAAWNGSSWSSLGTGMDSVVNCFAIHGSKLIAGGAFTTAGGTNANRVAAWNGLTWEALGSGVGPYNVQSLAVHQDTLYVGGDFMVAGDKASNCIAKWIKGTSAHVVTNLSDAGPGSLRAAILAARTSAATDTITFAVSGTINLQSPLPPFDGNGGTIADQGVVILGATAPGGVHSVILDGSALSSGDGLVINSNIGVGGCGSSVIDGLTIRNFPGNGVTLIEYPIPVWHTITNDLIYSNGGLAIDWGNDGVDANDWPDLADPYNHPELDSVRMNPDSSFTVFGHCTDSAARIDFYVAHPVNDDTRPADPSGYGEAYIYVGADTSAADKTFVYQIDKSYGFFTEVTATATYRYDTPWVTSEFSRNFNLTPSPLIIVAYSPVNIIVTDPLGRRFGLDAFGTPITEIPGGEYSELPNDSVVIPKPIVGEYLIGFVTEDDAPQGSTFSAIIRVDGTAQLVLAAEQQVPQPGVTATYPYEVEEGFHYLNGDGNDDERLNVADAVFIINYVFKGGPAPNPLLSGDANCDHAVNVADAVKIINRVFKSGPAPCTFTP